MLVSTIQGLLGSTIGGLLVSTIVDLLEIESLIHGLLGTLMFHIFSLGRQPTDF